MSNFSENAIAPDDSIIAVFNKWDSGRLAQGYDAIPALKRLAEILEEEYQGLLDNDPHCEFNGHVRLIFRKNFFFDTLINEYLREDLATRPANADLFDLHVAASRLLFIILEGTESSSVFSGVSSFIRQLYEWATNAEEPLRSYAICFVTAALEVPENRENSDFDELNYNLIELLSEDLQLLQQTATQESHQEISATRFENPTRLFPLTTISTQIIILRFLSSISSYGYQEFNENIYSVIQIYIDQAGNPQSNSHVILEALRYLSSLLHSPKAVQEYVNNDRVEKLMTVPTQSLASAGVSAVLSSLSYGGEGISRVCSLRSDTIRQLMGYALKLLLDNPDDLSKVNTSTFLAGCLQFKTLLDEFDRQEGFPKLYKSIPTLSLLPSDGEPLLDDEKEYFSRLLVRHVLLAIKTYLEAEIYWIYSEINSGLARADLVSFTANRIPKNLPVAEIIEFLQDHPSQWSPVEKFLMLGGVKRLLLIIHRTNEWNYRSRKACRSDTVKMAFDILTIVCAAPRTRLVSLASLCERLELPDMTATVGINLILQSAESGTLEVQRSTLNVLINCICGRSDRGEMASTSRQQVRWDSPSEEEALQKVWENVRKNNGIIILLSLLRTEHPLMDADDLRAKACRALAGLTRCQTVRQIISKLPLFTDGELQNMMKAPILQEKRLEHVEFQKWALQLIENVTGSVGESNFGTMADIHRANMVAQTKIQYNGKQLLQLIHQELIEKGLAESANTLAREANLGVPKCQLQRKLSPQCEYKFRSPSLSRPRLRSRTADLTISQSASPYWKSLEEARIKTTISGTDSERSTPIRIIKRDSKATPSPFREASKSRETNKLIDSYPSTSGGSQFEPFFYEDQSTAPSHVTLGTIVTEYLKNQHALCKYPVATCSPFDLFRPHKCPVPNPTKYSGIYLNVVNRMARRESGFRYSRNLDRRLIHSSFHERKTIRAVDSEAFFTCATYSKCSTKLLLGTYCGTIKVINLRAIGQEEDFSFSCYDTSLTNLRLSPDGRLIATATNSLPSQSTVWQFGDGELVSQWQVDGEEYLEFAHQTPNWIVGTCSEVATIYDLNTGQVVASLRPALSNLYANNRATFSPTDELILSDGVLWDVRGGVEVHKFDKLNQTISGVFHPNNLEVVANTEVWDLRTFNLLKTVGCLDKCIVKFSPQDVIFAFNSDPDSLGQDCSYRVLDAWDYSEIGNCNVNDSILDLAINSDGSQIAIVDFQRDTARIIDIGIRAPEEEIEQHGTHFVIEEEEEEEEGSDGSQDSMADLEMVLDYLMANFEDEDGRIEVEIAVADEETEDNAVEEEENVAEDEDE